MFLLKLWICFNYMNPSLIVPVPQGVINDRVCTLLPFSKLRVIWIPFATIKLTARSIL